MLPWFSERLREREQPKIKSNELRIRMCKEMNFILDISSQKLGGKKKEKRGIHNFLCSLFSMSLLGTS